MTTTTLVDTSFIESTHQSIKLSEPPPAARPAQPARLDASKLEIVRTTAPRELPCFAQLEFGRTVTGESWRLNEVIEETRHLFALGSNNLTDFVFIRSHASSPMDCAARMVSAKDRPVSTNQP